MNTTAIVPGDKIQEKKKTFTREDVLAACKKRYRVAVCVDHMEIALQQKTLQEAVNIIIDDSIYHDGHDRHVILTAEELKLRTQKTAMIGIVKAVLNALKKTGIGLTYKSIEKEINVQLGLRKVKIFNIQKFVIGLMMCLRSKKIVKFEMRVPIGQIHGEQHWELLTKKDLSDKDILELIPVEFLEMIQP